jgi:hypothetical protein
MSKVAEDIIVGLQAKYKPDLDYERQILLTESDVGEWISRSGLPNGVLYDELALKLALGFGGGTLDFSFCDHVINELHGVIMVRDEDRPDLFWSIFLAFDAGEFYPNGDRSVDPVETFTRPQIAKIVQPYSSGQRG